MIKINGKDVTAIHVGDKDVARVMLGGSVVWEAKPKGVRLVGKFYDTTECWVYINGIEYKLPQEFDFTFDGKWTFGQKDNRAFGWVITELTYTEGVNDLESMYRMFDQAARTARLTDLSGISNWDVSKVTTMEKAFSSNSKLTSIDISKWRTPKCESFESMFSGCSALTEIIGIENLDVSNATTLRAMLSGCKALGGDVLDLRKWDVSKCTTFVQLFAPTKFKAIDITGWSAPNLTGSSAIEYMFSNCSELKEIKGLETFNMPQITGWWRVFSGCTALETLNFTNRDFSKITSFIDAFKNCTSLTTVIGPVSGISVNISLADSPLTNDSAMVFINGLANVDTAPTITFHRDVYDALTEEQIAIATAKGWSVIRS